MNIHFPKRPFPRPAFQKLHFPRISLALRQLSRQRRKLTFSSPKGRIAKPIASAAALFVLSFLAGEAAAYGVNAWKQHTEQAVSAPVHNQGNLTIYSASNEGNWGLSFQQEGKPPVANASMDYLAQFNAHYAQDTDEKVLYLTFDAGYENGNTEAILDALKKHNAPATFFLVGNYLETSPELVKRMIADAGVIISITLEELVFKRLSLVMLFFVLFFWTSFKRL